MKIGITCNATVGGSGAIATALGKLLAEKGHEVHFICHEVPFGLAGERRAAASVRFQKGTLTALPSGRACGPAEPGRSRSGRHFAESAFCEMAP